MKSNDPPATKWNYFSSLLIWERSYDPDDIADCAVGPFKRKTQSFWNRHYKQLLNTILISLRCQRARREVEVPQ